MSLAQRTAEALIRVLRTAVRGSAAVTAVGIAAMMVITCADIVMRAVGRSLVGAYDLVRVAGAVSMACALPYITAVKGHVAIEYFLHKMRRPIRLFVERLLNTAGAALFVLLGSETIRSGSRIKLRGEVTATLQLPLFWVWWVIGFCCLVTAAVLAAAALDPRKELMKP